MKQGWHYVNGDMVLFTATGKQKNWSESMRKNKERVERERQQAKREPIQLKLFE
jgi:hypothetical protein